MKNYSLENPFAENDLPSPVKDQEQAVPSRYQEMVDRGRELLELPKKGGGESRVQVQLAQPAARFELDCHVVVRIF